MHARDLHVFDSRNAIAAGNGGAIVRTDDGAASAKNIVRMVNVVGHKTQKRM